MLNDLNNPIETRKKKSFLFCLRYCDPSITLLGHSSKYLKCVFEFINNSCQNIETKHSLEVIKTRQTMITEAKLVRKIKDFRGGFTDDPTQFSCDLLRILTTNHSISFLMHASKR